MGSTVITMVLGLCGVLSFGCAEVQKVEKEASGVAKEAEKSGALKDVEKAVEKKVEGKDDKADKADVKTEAKKDDKAATDKPAADAKKDDSADVEKAVKDAVGSAHGAAGVTVSVKAGVATLSGKVASAKDKTDLEAAVKKVKGVSKVTDELKVGK